MAYVKNYKFTATAPHPQPRQQAVDIHKVSAGNRGRGTHTSSRPAQIGCGHELMESEYPHCQTMAAASQ